MTKFRVRVLLIKEIATYKRHSKALPRFVISHKCIFLNFRNTDGQTNGRTDRQSNIIKVPVSASHQFRTLVFAAGQIFLLGVGGFGPLTALDEQLGQTAVTTDANGNSEKNNLEKKV
jgi:hypothetical protein